MPQGGSFCIEARWTISAAQDATGEVSFRQSEHEPVLIEGPSPGMISAELHGDARRPVEPLEESDAAW